MINGYPIGGDFMGYVDGRYIKFPSAEEYYELMDEEEEEQND